MDSIRHATGPIYRGRVVMAREQNPTPVEAVSKGIAGPSSSRLCGNRTPIQPKAGGECGHLHSERASSGTGRTLKCLVTVLRITEGDVDADYLNPDRHTRRTGGCECAIRERGYRRYDRNHTSISREHRLDPLLGRVCRPSPHPSHK